MKPAHGTFKERIFFIDTHVASVKVPEFSSHVDLSTLDTFLRASAEEETVRNPMEVIDDCTVFFLGILPHTLPSTGKSTSSTQLEARLLPKKKKTTHKFFELSLSTEYYAPVLS